MKMLRLTEFYLLRKEDVSGVSGTGVVARGIILPSGKVVMEWVKSACSVAVFDSISDVERIHGHDGKTEVLCLPEHEPVILLDDHEICNKR